jgi:hypothetical protein
LAPFPRVTTPPPFLTPSLTHSLLRMFPGFGRSKKDSPGETALNLSKQDAAPAAGALTHTLTHSLTH